MDDLKDLMHRRLQQAGAIKGVEASLIIEVAQKIFDEFFGPEPQLVRALYLKNRTLTVSVTGAPVAQELKKNERVLLQKISAAANGELIERIRYLL